MQIVSKEKKTFKGDRDKG